MWLWSGGAWSVSATLTVDPCAGCRVGARVWCSPCEVSRLQKFPSLPTRGWRRRCCSCSPTCSALTSAATEVLGSRHDSGRWCSTDIKAGHAVAVPWIPANFGGGRGAPSLSPGGHVAATARDSEGEGHVSVDAGARVETRVVAGRWGPCQSSKPQQSPLAVACAAGPAGEDGGGGRRRHLPCCRCSGKRENRWEALFSFALSFPFFFPPLRSDERWVVRSSLVRQHSC